MRSTSSSSGRVGFRFILLILLVLAICSATGGGAEGHTHPHLDDVVHRREDRLAAESEPNLFLETNTFRYQLLREVMDTIDERARRLHNDMRSLGDQIASIHFRSVVSSSEHSSSDNQMMPEELQAGLAALKAAVDAGMARLELEASYRSQDDAVVDRLRELRRRGQNDGGGGGGLLRRSVEELEEIIDHILVVHDAQSMSVLEAQQELSALHANISAAMDSVLVLVHHYSAAPSYNYSMPVVIFV